MRSALFWDFTQRGIVVPYRISGGKNSLRKIKKKHRCYLRCGGTLKYGTVVVFFLFKG